MEPGVPKGVDTDGRRVTARILLLQAVVAGVVALACLLAWNARIGASALAGAAISVVASLYMTLNSLRPAPTPRLAFRRIWVGQLLKYVLTVVLLVAVMRMTKVALPALFAGYVAMLLVYWWHAAARSRSAGVKKTTQVEDR